MKGNNRPISIRSFTEGIGILLTKLDDPPTDSFVGRYNPTCCHYFFDIAKADRKAVVEPDGVATDFQWVTVAVVAWGSNSCLHAQSIAEIAAASNGSSSYGNLAAHHMNR